MIYSNIVLYALYIMLFVVILITVERVIYFINLYYNIKEKDIISAFQSKRLFSYRLNLLNYSKTLNGNQDILDIYTEREISRFSRGLGVLDFCVVVAPILGILGTVIGIMQAFGGFDSASKGDILAIAQGLSYALITTAIGLVIAITALLFSYILKKFVLFFSEDILNLVVLITGSNEKS